MYFNGGTHIWLCTWIIDLSSDIEKNSGPSSSSSQEKIDVSLESKQSETYLGSSISLHDVNLEVQGYELFWLGHPSQDKRVNTRPFLEFLSSKTTRFSWLTRKIILLHYKLVLKHVNLYLFFDLRVTQAMILKNVKIVWS